jgi:hypothetical protein
MSARPDPEGLLATRLRAEADRHSPDPGRMLLLVRARINSTAEPNRHRMRGWAPALVAATAVAAVVLVVAVLLPQLGRSGPPAPATQPTSASVVLVRAADTLVTLADGGTVDWLVADPSRPDAGAPVIGAPRKDVPEPGLGDLQPVGAPTVEVRPGPFTVRWTGGRPPQASGSSEGAWTSYTVAGTAPPGGFSVRLKRPGAGTQMALFVGVQATHADLTVLVGGQPVDNQRLAPSDTLTTGYVITVPLPDGGARGDVEVRLVSAAGGTVSCAAVLVR